MSDTSVGLVNKWFSEKFECRLMPLSISLRPIDKNYILKKGGGSDSKNTKRIAKFNTGMVFFKVLFHGEQYETDRFNVGLLVRKYLDQVHEISVKNVKEAKRRLIEKWREHNGKK